MLAETIKRYVPPAIKTGLRSFHRDVVLNHSLRRFRSQPPEVAARDQDLLSKLVWSWGNEGWSGGAEYLSAAIGLTVPGKRAVLECGTGLTTVLMGLAARTSSTMIYSLEHMPEWSARIRQVLARYDVENVQVFDAPIIAQGGEYEWYDVGQCRFPTAGFDAVVCDGPPHQTAGGRYGLLPVMADRLRSGCAILLDDIERPGEQAVVRRWQTEYGVSIDSDVEHASFVWLAVGAKPDGRLTNGGRVLR